MTAWWRVLKITISTTTPCKFTPLWHNPDFHIRKTPIHFHTWEEKGITHLHHLFNNNNFMTFQDLSQKYAIENQQSFYYIQLKTIIRNKINIRNNTLTPPQISEEIMQIGNDNKLISKLYKLLTKSDTLIHVPQT